MSMQYRKLFTLYAVGVPQIIADNFATIVGGSAAGAFAVILVVTVTVVVAIALCYMLKTKGEYCMSLC